jgi:hypothetical protein
VSERSGRADVAPGERVDVVGPVVGIIGCGVTGGQVATLLREAHDRRVGLIVHDRQPAIARRLASFVSGIATERVEDLATADVVACCHPSPHAELAERFLDAGVSVVSTSDDPDDVIDLLSIGHVPGMPRRGAAQHRPAVDGVSTGASLVVGAAMAPGLSGLLARSLAAQLDAVDEVHVAVAGTGGPSCARRHHRALGDRALGWADGDWVERPGGSGRELCWFPEPLGAHDCYRAAHADPILLHLAFAEVQRITLKVAATRRDRLTARLPMLRPPHVGGNDGGLRVEVRGALDGDRRWTVIAGAAGRVAALASAVCAGAVEACLDGQVSPGIHALGDATLEPAGILGRAVAHGVTIQEFTGVARPTTW